MAIEDISIALPAPRPLRLADVALFLDLDGTLAPIASRPQDVRPDARRTNIIQRLSQATLGRLAVISGRTLTDVDRILERRVTAVAAVHGLVRREPDGTVHQAEPHPALALAAERFRDFAAKDSGLIVEEKGLSVALHYRLARAYAHPVRQLAMELADETGLILQNGDMVEELRTPGPNKGDSVAEFLSRPPFRGCTPVFLGDDATDEHGFEAVTQAGGFGVLVGPARDTHARYRLNGVGEALSWLEASL